MADNIKIRIENFGLRYSDGTESLHDITLDIYAKQINVLFGPAGGGKSTLLRAMNRLNDLTDVVEQTGHIFLDGEDVTQPDYDVVRLRRRVGIVFARPVVLPMRIFFADVVLIRWTNCSGVNIPFFSESLAGFSSFAIGLRSIRPSVSAQFRNVLSVSR